MRYSSFLFGIVISSVTWIVSLYLYWNLSGETQVAHYRSTDSNQLHAIVPLSDQKISNSIDSDFLRGEKLGKSSYYKKKKYNYQNSHALLKHLEAKPVVEGIDALGMVHSPAERVARDEGYKVHAFNTLVSDRLALNREIPDTRHELCKTKVYNDALATASIIICFYNEHYRTLLRTVRSVLDRTPKQLLHEIILVDDNSDVGNLHDDVRNYVTKHFPSKVSLVKTPVREGLIRARMFGANTANGEVLVFLDSHVEVNKEWLQPLLARIAANNSTVAVPIIDIINADTFEYTSSPLVRGGFNWGLHFKWDNLPTGTLATTEDFVHPIKTPTMAGGLFAINRKYFEKIGAYDAGMNIWGGENLEMSFRVWMCGGRLELIPCSRIGHVFRRRRPYGSPTGEDTMTRNSLRVAHVWMDDYKKYYLQLHPKAKDVHYGDIAERQKLREQLHCKSFQWYLENIYPELSLPDEKKEVERLQIKYQPWHSRQRNYVDQFQIRLTNTTLCLTSAKDMKSRGSPLVLLPCLRTRNQMWYETDKRELVLGQLLCLLASNDLPVLGKCHEMGGDQEWRHTDQKETPIYNIASGTCLGAQRPKKEEVVKLLICADHSHTRWELVRQR